MERNVGILYLVLYAIGVVESNRSSCFNNKCEVKENTAYVSRKYDLVSMTKIVGDSGRPERSTIVGINTNKAYSKVHRAFLSTSIGANIVAHDFRHSELQSPRLIALCQGLNDHGNGKHLFFRLGGSSADFIFYKSSGLDELPHYTLNNTEWDMINNFASRLGWSLIFGLNELTLSKPDGAWNPSNAINLLRYTRKMGYSVQYELGNEPDLYPGHENRTIQPAKAAKNFKLLKLILKQEAERKPMVIGPDVTSGKGFPYLKKFLYYIKPGVLDAITYHFYYGPSKGAVVNNFTDPEYLDKFLFKALEANKIIKGVHHLRGTPVWLGESSSTYGGGVRKLGMSFAAGFLYLDKLGLAAQLNISVVIKESLYTGHYALIDRTSLNPSPSYWIAVLHKQLVGTKVLSISGMLQFGSKLRLYAHCINPHGRYQYNPSSIVVFGLNLDKDNIASVQFRGKLRHLAIHQYLLTPGNNSVSDGSAKLNGKILKMSGHTSLPDISPKLIMPPIRLPPLSYGFFVLFQANAKACMSDAVEEI